MKIEDKSLWAGFAVVAFLLFCLALYSNEFNSFISHPLVSGFLIALAVSVFLPKRIEAESRNSLLRGFYDDMEFIAKRYEALGVSIVECATKRSFSFSDAVGPVVHGNESLSISRLNQQLQLSQQQKKALINVENAVNVINLNLQANIDRINENLKAGRNGLHFDDNMKAAFDSLCYLSFTLRRIVELQDRFKLELEPADCYRMPVLHVMYPNDKHKRELMLKWLETDAQLVQLILSS